MKHAERYVLLTRKLQRILSRFTNFMVKQIWNADESGYPELDSKHNVITK